MNKQLRYGLSFILMIGLCAPAALAQSGEPSLDELLELEQPAPESPQEAPAEPTPPENVERLLQERERGAEPVQVFRQAVQEMDHAAQRLGQARDAGVETQRVQQSILNMLDQTIAAAQRQQNSPSGGSGSGGQQQQARQQDSGSQQLAQQNQPGQAQGSAGGQAGGGEGHQGGASPGSAQAAGPDQQALQQLRQEWGTLPPRLREEISEGLQERFSPVYRALTEAYYQRLAEEQ